MLGAWEANSQACFFATDTVGCAPFTVTMNECVTDPTAVIKYKFEDNFVFENTHTYTTPGFYNVTQIIQIGINQDQKVKPKYIRVVSNHKPNFSLNPCENKTVKIQINENLYDRYVVIYPDGSPNDTLAPNGFKEKTFSDLADKTIRVKGEYFATSCSNFDEKTTFLIATLTKASILNLLKTDTKTIQLTANLNPKNQYSIEKRSSTGTYQFLENIQNPTSNFNYTYSNSSLESSSFCFRFRTYDNCGNEVYSDEICTEGLKATPNNGKNDITWNSYIGTNFSQFQLYKNDNLIYTGTNLSYTDTLVNCGVNYCYFLKTVLNYASNPAEVSSEKTCIIAISTTLPIPAEKVYASIENEKVVLNWTLTQKESIQSQVIERKKGTSNFSTLLSINDNRESEIIADSLNLLNPPSYRIQLTDKCNNKSETDLAAITCPTILDYNLPTPDQVTVTWTNYEGFKTPKYTLILLNQTKDTLAQIPVSGTSYSFAITEYLAKEFIFIIKIEDKSTGLTAYSNTKSLLVKTYVYFPTGFTPNDDNLNDTFYPIGNFIREYEIKIYTQQGNLIFSSPKPNTAWDGYYKGEKAATGVYIYTATIKDSNNEVFERQGTITLIR